MEYKHKKTGFKVKLEMTGACSQYRGGDFILHPAFVENSDEWELIDNGKKYTIDEIRQAIIQINTYSIPPNFMDHLIKKLNSTNNG